MRNGVPISILFNQWLFIRQMALCVRDIMNYRPTLLNRKKYLRDFQSLGFAMHKIPLTTLLGERLLFEKMLACRPWEFIWDKEEPDSMWGSGYSISYPFIPFNVSQKSTLIVLDERVIFKCREGLKLVLSYAE